MFALIFSAMAATGKLLYDSSRRTDIQYQVAISEQLRKEREAREKEELGKVDARWDYYCLETDRRIESAMSKVDRVNGGYEAYTRHNALISLKYSIISARFTTRMRHLRDAVEQDAQFRLCCSRHIDEYVRLLEEPPIWVDDFFETKW